MEEVLYDIIIIGAGPIGIACALKAKKSGLSYLVLEKGPLVNSLYNYPANMQFFQLVKSLRLKRSRLFLKKQNLVSKRH